MIEGLRFYLDEVSVKTLFAELKEAREELAKLKADQGVRYTLQDIRKELKWDDAPSAEELREEDFSDTSRVCNWRRYIYNKSLWESLTDLQRLVAYKWAQDQADREEWD